MPVDQIELCSVCDPQRIEGRGAIQASFLYLSMRFWKGWWGGKRPFVTSETKEEAAETESECKWDIFPLETTWFSYELFFSCICPDTFPLLFDIQKPNDDNKSKLHTS